jgi:hypothetical protein
MAIDIRSASVGDLVLCLGMKRPGTRDISYRGSLMRVRDIGTTFVVVNELANTYTLGGIMAPDPNKPVVLDTRDGWEFEEPTPEHLAARGLSHLIETAD